MRFVCSKWKALCLTAFVGVGILRLSVVLMMQENVDEPHGPTDTEAIKDSSLSSNIRDKKDLGTAALGNKSRKDKDKDPAARAPDDPKVHRSGGPVWPAGAASSYNWTKAVGKMVKVGKRKKDLMETIFALDPSGREQPCGKPCLAHCIAGQPREMATVKGLWKATKHRLFDAMSEAPVVFAVLSTSWMRNDIKDEGAVGFVRNTVSGADHKGLVKPLTYMEVDRALLLQESCQTGGCLKKAAGIVCDASKLRLTTLYDKDRGIMANFCDVQVRRFQTCMNLVREYESDHSISFDWVTRQRPDVYWTKLAGKASKIDPDAVYLHDWAACGYGGADWFYMAPRALADIVARFPDEFSCSHYHHKLVLPTPCQDCLGCECTLVAWLLRNKVAFKKMPFNDNVPSKFCGDQCPADFKVPRPTAPTRRASIDDPKSSSVSDLASYGLQDFDSLAQVENDSSTIDNPTFVDSSTAMDNPKFVDVANLTDMVNGTDSVIISVTSGSHKIVEPKMRGTDDPLKHRTGGPVWPVGTASSYPWDKAVGNFFRVPSRKEGLQETIFAFEPFDTPKVCGKPCVAHCIAGQPRDMITMPGLWKSMKHRLFNTMSKGAVVFGVLSTSVMTGNVGKEGAAGYIRGDVGAVSHKKLLEPLQYMQVERALLLDEACQSGSCLKKQAGIVCDAKELGLIALYDKKTGVVANFCDVQVRRFQTCVNLIREFEQDYTNIKIDWVTRQRPDVYWTAPSGAAMGLKPTAVYFRSWGACGYGGADWFYVASRAHADIIARFPDEFACSHYHHKLVLPTPCHGCLGCECTLIAWLLNNSVRFKPLPFNDLTPTKFCGDCPQDFKVRKPKPRRGNQTK